MTKDELIETLGSIEHERWADWQRYVHDSATPHEYSNGIENRIGLLLDADRVAAWRRQIATPYSRLSERERESDREQVARYWPLIVDFVAEWLGDQMHMDQPPEELQFGHALIDAWREEMGA